MTLGGHFPINWHKVDNYVVYNNTVTELHYCRDVENYINSRLIEKSNRIILFHLFFQIMLAECQVLFRFFSPTK